MTEGWKFYVLLFAIGLAFGSAVDAARNAREANSALQQITGAIEEASHD